MNKLIIIVIPVLVSLPFAVNASEFEAYLSEQNNAYLNDDAVFEKAQAKEKLEFDIYRRKILNAYKNYKKQIAEFWGENNTVVSDNHHWVEYHDNMKERHIVDFEKGTATVELLLDKNESDDLPLIQEKLKQAVVKTVTKNADQRSIIDIAKNPSLEVSNAGTHAQAVLSKQLRLKNGKMVTSDNAKTFAEETTNNSFKIKKIKGSDNLSRKVALTRFNLIPDHIRQRAEQFKTLVNKYAKQYDVSKNLIYAVIETESFFNPAARSNAPAFGLMQLVPFYGGREAYRFVHNKDHVPSDRYLYNPENNIRLGSAYLHVLYFSHMNEIKNREARLWCAIASYNTGPTNVYSAVIGKFSRSHFRKYAYWKNKAIREINKMQPEALFELLRRQLPYQETRSYIKNVRSRMGKYSSL